MADGTDKRRGPGRRWQAGETGNALGRPKIGSPRWREGLHKAALLTLRRAVEGKLPEVRAATMLRAAVATLDRLEGKPPQQDSIPAADPAIANEPEQARRAKIAAFAAERGNIVTLTREAWLAGRPDES